MSAFIATAFAQNDAEAARTQWSQVAVQRSRDMCLETIDPPNDDPIINIALRQLDAAGRSCRKARFQRRLDTAAWAMI